MEGIELMVWDKATLGYLASPTKMKLTPQPRIPDPNPIPDSRFPIPDSATSDICCQIAY